jgi:acetyl esterase/lipase
MRELLRLVAACTLTILVACSGDGPQRALPVEPGLRDTSISNVAYGPAALQAFDIALPASRNATTPLVIVIHGGAWITGDKSELAFLASGLFARGFAVANVNYRLASFGNDNIGMQLDDIGRAIEFAQARASTYGFNAQRVYLVGHSAGAHLALTYAYSRNAAARVRAVASLAGPTDLYSLAFSNPLPGDWTIGLGALLNQPLFPLTTASEARYRAVSPFSLATATSPPTILFHGDADQRVPIEQSASLSTRLGTLGVPKKYITYAPSVAHEWWNDVPRRNDTLDQLREWFNAHP